MKEISHIYSFKCRIQYGKSLKPSLKVRAGIKEWLVHSWLNWTAEVCLEEGTKKIGLMVTQNRGEIGQSKSSKGRTHEGFGQMIGSLVAVYSNSCNVIPSNRKSARYHCSAEIDYTFDSRDDKRMSYVKTKTVNAARYRKGGTKHVYTIRRNIIIIVYCYRYEIVVLFRRIPDVLKLQPSGARVESGSLIPTAAIAVAVTQSNGGGGE